MASNKRKMEEKNRLKAKQINKRNARSHTHTRARVESREGKKTGATHPFEFIVLLSRSEWISAPIKRFNSNRTEEGGDAVISWSNKNNKNKKQKILRHAFDCFCVWALLGCPVLLTNDPRASVSIRFVLMIVAGINLVSNFFSLLARPRLCIPQQQKNGLGKGPKSKTITTTAKRRRDKTTMKWQPQLTISIIPTVVNNFCDLLQLIYCTQPHTHTHMLGCRQSERGRLTIFPSLSFASLIRCLIVFAGHASLSLCMPVHCDLPWAPTRHTFTIRF